MVTMGLCHSRQEQSKTMLSRADLIFDDDYKGETFDTSDHPVIMQMMRCGIGPVSAGIVSDGRRIEVRFKNEDAINVVRKTATDNDLSVKLSDVMRADVVWKQILDVFRM